MSELGRVYETKAAERLVVQQVFLGFVDQLRKGQIGTLPDLVESLNTTGSLSEYVSPFQTEDPELLLEPTVYSELAGLGDGKSPDRIGFEFQNMLGVGKGDSRRSVSFGTASVSWFDRNGVRATIPLAVKVFGLKEEENRRMLLHEAGLLKHCADKGLNAPRVFGIARCDMKHAALLTYFEPGLITLDNIQWSMLAREDQDYHLSTAVEALVSIHEQGLFHGDSEFKNIAFSEQEGETIAVDLEHATLTTGLQRGPAMVTLVAQRMSQDLRAVKKSMQECRLIAGQDAKKFKQFQERFLQPYFERLTRSQGDNKGVLMEAYGRVVESLAAEAYGQDFTRILQGVGRFAIK